MDTISIVTIVVIIIFALLIICEWVFFLIKSRKQRKEKLIKQAKQKRQDIFESAEQIEDWLNKGFQNLVWENSNDTLLVLKEMERRRDNYKISAITKKEFAYFISWKYYEYLLEEIKKGNKK